MANKLIFKHISHFKSYCVIKKILQYFSTCRMSNFPRIMKIHRVDFCKNEPPCHWLFSSIGTLFYCWWWKWKYYSKIIFISFVGNHSSGLVNLLRLMIIKMIFRCYCLSMKKGINECIIWSLNSNTTKSC